jgi:UDP-N-acetylmuramate dehydrogenase
MDPVLIKIGKAYVERGQILAIFSQMTDITRNRSLKELNTFGLDSQAAHYARCADTESLNRLLEDESLGRLPLLVLGEGSNILFRSNFEGLVLQPGMKGIELLEENHAEVLVKVGAAENWDRWVDHAVGQGWYGLENLSLIPGSVGSSPVQNIGAYGVELSDRFEWLDAWDLQLKQPVKLDRETCRFAYRSSLFKEEAGGRYIITHVAFRLKKKAELNLEYGSVKEEFLKAGGADARDLRNVISAIRRSKLPDPDQYGNAGSFFKNPVIDRTLYKCIRVDFPDMPYHPAEDNHVKIPAAWLIDRAGWKGKQIGDVGTWPNQPLVIVNYGNATGQDIYEFSEAIREDVDQLFGINLEREVRVI